MRTLFVTEPEFLNRHVGVRRVILHYARKLIAAGWKVEFGAPHSGKIVLGDVDANRARSVRSPRTSASWSSRHPVLEAPEGGSSRKQVHPVRWNGPEINPDDYDTIVITTPWLCALGIPPLPRVVGIVYDMVPNLLAAGCLRFPRYLDVFGFAREHDLGYRYYLANASRVTCISESTRADFREMYRTAAQLPSLVCDIPFEVTGTPVNGEEHTVLLVNALDWRKNLVGIDRALAIVAKRIPVKLRVVGEERIRQNDALQFLERMAAVCQDVEWYRDVDDGVLDRQYAQAALLFFPSLYEGLGLPVLEAQEFGKPAITSDVSSCVEVNMNPALCIDPDDADAMAKCVMGVLTRTAPVLTGNALVDALSKFLSGRHDPIAVFDLASGAGADSTMQEAAPRGSPAIATGSHAS